MNLESIFVIRKWNLPILLGPHSSELPDWGEATYHMKAKGGKKILKFFRYL